MLPPHSLSPPPPLSLVINQIWLKQQRGGGGGVVGFKRPRDEQGIQDTRGFCLRPCAWPRCKTRQREVRLVQEFLFVLVNQSSTTTTQ